MSSAQLCAPKFCYEDCKTDAIDAKYKFCKAISLKNEESNHLFFVKKLTFLLDTSENIKDVRILFNLSPICGPPP